ncbi:hypothetical protein, partial [Psychrobacter sp. TB55-MNA-CIBAN-0194]|uniref:hypothetical protein n=1 Tax=Psychrobacter sp. TB55-MNA-CIBAN-0194 TaxID=3140445 RepID=UPI00332EE2CE
MESHYALPGESEYNIVAERVESVEVSAAQLRGAGIDIPDKHQLMQRTLMKTGNRDVYGSDFRWVIDEYLTKTQRPEMLFTA